MFNFVVYTHCLIYMEICTEFLMINNEKAFETPEIVLAQLIHPVKVKERRVEK